MGARTKTKLVKVKAKMRSESKDDMREAQKRASAQEYRLLMKAVAMVDVESAMAVLENASFDLNGW